MWADDYIGTMMMMMAGWYAIDRFKCVGYHIHHACYTHTHTRTDIYSAKTKDETANIANWRRIYVCECTNRHNKTQMMYGIRKSWVKINERDDSDACRYNVLCWLLPCRTVGVLWWLRNPLAVNMPDETHSTIKMWESIADETENHYIIQTTNVPLISWGVCVGGDAWLCVSKSISPFTQSTSGEKLDKWFDYTWCAGGCVRGLFFGARFPPSNKWRHIQMKYVIRYKVRARFRVQYPKCVMWYDLTHACTQFLCIICTDSRIWCVSSTSLWQCDILMLPFSRLDCRLSSSLPLSSWCVRNTKSDWCVNPFSFVFDQLQFIPYSTGRTHCRQFIVHMPHVRHDFDGK